MGRALAGMSLLLDTCAVIWLACEPERLSDAARKRLVDPLEGVHVSAITAGELACLVFKGRLELPVHWRTWFQRAIAANGWTVLPIDLQTVEEAYSLPGDFHADPADRILVATARLKQFTLVTGDQRLLDYPHLPTLA